MRVLHVIPTLSQSSGGPPNVALNLVKYLRDIGIDAEIVTTNHDYPNAIDVPLNQRIDYCFGTDHEQQDSSVPVWFLPYDPPTLKEFIFSKALTKWLWQHIQTYDIVDNHYLFSYAPTCAAAIARFKRIPYTVRTMGQLTPWALAQSRLKKQAYSFLIERRNLKRAAAIHCTSSDEALDVQRFGIKTPTLTLPLGVNPPEQIADAPQKLRRAYGIPLETPVVLFLSRIHYKKRPDLLIQTIAQIVQQQNCHLILAGSGEPEYLTTLQHLAGSLGVSDRITFAGFVTGQDKNLLLQGSDLFVLPSYSENFGIAVAEALVSGLPVIVTPDVQIASDIEQAQAGLVLEADVEKLTAAMVELFQSPSRCRQLSENGKRLAKERYAWHTIAQELTSGYASIIERRAFQGEIRNEIP